MTQDHGGHRSVWTHLMTTSFRQDWIDVGGVRTRYVQAGPKDAPAVVMLHGTGGSWECFCANIAPYSRQFNCFALDMVGCGFTDKPNRDYEIPSYVQHVQGFMSAVGIQRASFVGVSLGAWVAARLAIDHPECVQKLVLLAASGLRLNAQTMASIRGLRTAAVQDSSWENVKSVFVPLIYDEQHRIDDFVAVRQAVYRLPEMARTMPQILCLQDPAIRARNLIPEMQWQQLAAPTLIIAAPDDKADYYETAVVISKLLPHARLVEFKRVKHWAQFEAADAFNNLSIDFIANEHS